MKGRYVKVDREVKGKGRKEQGRDDGREGN